jgi:putative endonuclease
LGVGESKKMQNWWVYIIEKRKKFYVGITTDLPNRMRQHGADKPLYQEGPISESEALKRERTLKGWTREKKLTLIKNTFSQLM